MGKEKCYSIDGENYEDLDSVMATLESEHAPGTTITIFEGVPRKITHAEFIHPESILDAIAESAYGDMGDFVGDYLDDLRQDAGALSDLEDLLNGWLEKKAGPVSFWGVESEKEIEVVVGR